MEMTGMKRMSFRTIHSLLDRCLRQIEKAAIILAGGLLLIVMVLVSYDTASRYLFNAPLGFQYFLTENYLLIALVTMAFSWGFRTGGYIRIQGITNLLPISLRNAILRLGLIASGLFVAVLAWKGGKYFLKIYLAGEVEVGTINWPIAWSWIWVPVGCGLLALRVLLIAVGPDEGLNIEYETEGDTV